MFKKFQVGRTEFYSLIFALRLNHIKSVLDSNDKALKPDLKKTEYFSRRKKFNRSRWDKTDFRDKINSYSQHLRVGFCNGKRSTSFFIDLIQKEAKNSSHMRENHSWTRGNALLPRAYRPSPKPEPIGASVPDHLGPCCVELYGTACIFLNLAQLIFVLFNIAMKKC